MYFVRVVEIDTLDWFREAARRLLAANVEPAAVIWGEHDEDTLFENYVQAPDSTANLSPAHVPRSFLAIAEAVACHREPQRWLLLYQALWRITHGENRLPDIASDPLMHRLRRMATAVKHDKHRMTAFVRFRVQTDRVGDRFVAWYEPEHRILRQTAEFFIDRFAAMRFSIVTSYLSLHWDGGRKTFCAGSQRQGAQSEDVVETWWQEYYSATFNPARVNPQLMARHMPKRFWGNLPEAAAIQELLSGAIERTERMVGDVPLIGDVPVIAELP